MKQSIKDIAMMLEEKYPAPETIADFAAKAVDDGLIDGVEEENDLIDVVFLNKDESDKFPICGKYNATKRALRRVKQFEKESGVPVDGLERALMIENEISVIVNACDY